MEDLVKPNISSGGVSKQIGVQEEIRQLNIEQTPNEKRAGKKWTNEMKNEQSKYMRGS